MDGIVEMSGPCEPSAIPFPSQVMTAERWRRFPLTRISVWSGARLRKLAGRTTVAASLIGWVLMLKEGITVRNWVAKSRLPWLEKSSGRMTSTGTVDSVADLGSARLPTTTIEVVTAPNSSEKLRRTDWPAISSTLLALAGSKPEASTVTV